MDADRRRLLQAGSAAFLLPTLTSTLLTPSQVWAAGTPRAAFAARNLAEALKLSGLGQASESRSLQIQAPEIAENGARVEVEITSLIPGTQSLAVFAEKNPLPLCGEWIFHPPALPFAKIQLRLAESTRLRVVARTQEGKQHVAFREIKVTLGGCSA